eukprot:403339381
MNLNLYQSYAEYNDQSVSNYQAQRIAPTRETEDRTLNQNQIQSNSVSNNEKKRLEVDIKSVLRTLRILLRKDMRPVIQSKYTPIQKQLKRLPEYESFRLMVYREGLYHSGIKEDGTCIKREKDEINDIIALTCSSYNKERILMFFASELCKEAFLFYYDNGKIQEEINKNQDVNKIDALTQALEFLNGLARE